MKEFFKYMLASMLGFIILGVIIVFIFLGLVTGLVAHLEKQEVTVKNKTVIRIDLVDPIPERTPKDNLMNGLRSGSFKTILGLNDILKNIKAAKDDENIEGLHLNLNMVPSGLSTLQEIRTALLDFKESGKFILCYGEYMTQSAYFLGSVADEIYLHPEGFIDFKGLNARVMFIKGLLDKLDINMQIVRHGKFKSAVEPLMQKKMSDANREQYNRYIRSVWEVVLGQISLSRGLSVQELNNAADALVAYDADKAKIAGLVDDIVYRDGYRNIIAARLGVEDLDDINFISLSQYDRVIKDIPVTRDRVAVIYATGSIVGGSGSYDEVGADKFAETIAKVREDDNVKAVVLRVNSPGGDAIASDIIWRELDLLKVKKPIVVSMGDVAASGGYWISSASTRILANPTTLTGSIGVFGVVPDFGEFMENKLGITYDRVKTNENAGFPPIMSPMTAYQRNMLQERVDDIYDLFLLRVSNNRNLPLEEVDKNGEGRIWSGFDARSIHLIDGWGGLYDAIEVAAEIGGVETYRLLELPILKDPIDQMIEDLSSSVFTERIETELGPFYNDYKQIQSIMEWQGVQARLPYIPYIE